MARGRPRSNGPTATSSQRSAQSTLSFNNKTARVTKPAAQNVHATKKSRLSDQAEAEVVEATSIATPEPEAETKPDSKPEQPPQTVEIELQPSPSKSRVKARTKKAPAADGREAAAAKITDAQIKKYWKAEEDSRLAPRGIRSCLIMPARYSH